MYLCKLNELILLTSVDSKTAIVVSNTNIKNQVAISITYIHIHNTPIVKMIHYAINVIFIKAKSFVIRCSLNQTTQLTNIECIIVVTDSIHIVKKYSTLSFICIRSRYYLSLRNLESFS